MAEHIRVADLFAGIGGFHIAFENQGAEVVFASEWDKNARTTYRANFEATSPALFADDEKNFAGDITKVDPEDIPDIDVLTGGFPCQPFSNAGKKAGFGDTRGTLFFNIKEILRVKRPKAFFLENVQNLLGHDEGNTFKTIQQEIASLNYTLHYRVVRASEFNVPQHRPRLYLIGFREDIDDSSFAFPEAVELTNTISKVMGGRVTMLSGKERTIGFTLRVGGRNSSVNDRRCWDAYIVDGEETRITIDQARQIQGFPADYKFPVSTTAAFKQLGNSVAVPAIEAHAAEIKRILNLPQNLSGNTAEEAAEVLATV